MYCSLNLLTFTLFLYQRECTLHCSFIYLAKGVHTTVFLYIFIKGLYTTLFLYLFIKGSGHHTVPLYIYQRIVYYTVPLYIYQRIVYYTVPLYIYQRIVYYTVPLYIYQKDCILHCSFIYLSKIALLVSSNHGILIYQTP